MADGDTTCAHTLRAVVFFMYTIVSTSTLELFSCIAVDSRSPRSRFRGKWLVHDMSQRCFEGAHLRYMLGVGIPGAAAGRGAAGAHWPWPAQSRPPRPPVLGN